MNPFKGAGIALLLGIFILALTRIPSVNDVVLSVTAVVIVVSLTTYLASFRRRRRDRRSAGE